MTEIIGMDGSREAAPESFFVTRSPPGITVGPYHPGILLAAAESTRSPDFGFAEFRMEDDYRIQRLLNPPPVTDPGATYEQKLTVMMRMLKMIEEDWRRNGSGAVRIDGDFFDPLSGKIVNYETTPYIHVLNRGGRGWELHIDTSKPDTTFAFFRDPFNDNLVKLVRRLERGKMKFGGEGAQTLISSYKGWKVPIIGLQRVLVVDFESETRYEEGQTTVRAPKQSRVGDYPSYLTLRDDGSLDMA
ncbi:hypothetical protein J4464_02330 [Candidatus Woesearchaeota archaeon]|nr:hypothetical protein [Candidatus Woesearchaeota archaeon]